MCPAPFRIRLERDGVEITLGPGTYLLGRAYEAAVRIESPAVSRHHARIEIDRGTAMIEDLGSKNGTFVDGRRVVEPVSLTDGCRVRLGQLAARLRVAFEASADCI